ncbi:MAG: hypothetical protein ACLFMM_09850 [Methanohalobium sp.]|uniref:hypothetical protein n=1 Tax=Methanohalobium sp. TaxID=2837493 RepID=UPI00397E7398
MSYKQTIFFILFIIPSLIFAQDETRSKERKIPEPFYIHVKAYQKGETVFEVNTKKQTVFMSVPEKNRDTTFSIKWDQEAKITFLKYLVDNDRLESMKKNAASQQPERQKKGDLLHVYIHKGEEKVEFWSEESDRKKDSDSFESMKFVRKLMEYYNFPFFKTKNVRKLKR